MKTYVFGDSYSVEFDDSGLYPPGYEYCNWKGYVPKKYFHLLSEKFESTEIINYAMSGNDNENIFEKFTEEYDKIEPDDLVIFGWTAMNRFSICNYEKIGVPKSDLWSSSVSYNHFDWVVKSGANKTTLLYFNRNMKLINFINRVLKDNKVVHWYWDYKPGNELNDDKTIKAETKGVVNDFHYNEKAHLDLYDRISKLFESTNHVCIDLWLKSSFPNKNLAIDKLI
jgi:hypothetical protein